MGVGLGGTHSSSSLASSVSNSASFRMKGFAGAAVSEGLWTCGYFSIPPMLHWHLHKLHPERFDSNNKARILTALLGGLFACYLTHPFDTVKTCGTFLEMAGLIMGRGGSRHYTWAQSSGMAGCAGRCS